MTGKPLLFWDVDGVFNRYPLQNVTGGEWLRHTIDLPGMPRPVPLVLDPGDVKRVRSLDDIVEHVWATTWNDRANTHLAPLIGLDPMPVAPMNRRFSEYDVTAEWKWDHVLQYAGIRPFAWIDDGFTMGMLTRGNRRTAHTAPTLLITADPATGLTDDIVDSVRMFADIAARG